MCHFRRQVQTPARPSRSLSSSLTRVVRRGQCNLVIFLIILPLKVCLVHIFRGGNKKESKETAIGKILIPTLDITENGGVSSEGQK